MIVTRTTLLLFMLATFSANGLADQTGVVPNPSAMTVKSLEPQALENSGVGPLTLADLPVVEAKTRIYRKEVGGGVIPIFGKITAENTNVIFVQDLMIYKPVKLDGKDRRIGSMVRIRADFKTKAKDIELSSLWSLSANSNKVEGNVQFASYGITGKGVITHVPMPPVGINETALGDCLQALNLIRGKIGDEDAVISPMLLPDIQEDTLSP